MSHSYDAIPRSSLMRKATFIALTALFGLACATLTVGKDHVADRPVASAGEGDDPHTEFKKVVPVTIQSMSDNTGGAWNPGGYAGAGGDVDDRRAARGSETTDYETYECGGDEYKGATSMTAVVSDCSGVKKCCPLACAQDPTWKHDDEDPLTALAKSKLPVEDQDLVKTDFVCACNCITSSDLTVDTP